MRFFILLFIVGASFFSSCLFEKSDVPVDLCSGISYSRDVVPIIETHCALNGCHVSGFSQGNFNSYDTLYSKIESGAFQLRVFELGSMPPNDSLSEKDLSTFKCWIYNGAPDD